MDSEQFNLKLFPIYNAILYVQQYECVWSRKQFHYADFGGRTLTTPTYTVQAHKKEYLWFIRAKNPARGVCFLLGFNVHLFLAFTLFFFFFGTNSTEPIYFLMPKNLVKGSRTRLISSSSQFSMTRAEIVENAVFFVDRFFFLGVLSCHEPSRNEPRYRVWVELLSEIWNCLHVLQYMIRGAMAYKYCCYCCRWRHIIIFVAFLLLLLSLILHDYFYGFWPWSGPCSRKGYVFYQGVFTGLCHNLIRGLE